MAEQKVKAQLIAFKSGALPDDDVELKGFVGRERLSRLFEFELILARREPYTDQEIDDLLRSPCAIAMGGRKGDIVHGILSSIQLHEPGDGIAAFDVNTIGLTLVPCAMSGPCAVSIVFGANCTVTPGLIENVPEELILPVTR